MRREDADDRHARARERPAGHGQPEREHARAGDDLAVVEHGVHPVEWEQGLEALDVLARRRPAEVVADRPERGGVLVHVADGADTECHPSILGARRCRAPYSFSSGA